MEYQPYIDNLINDGTFSQAAIAGFDGAVLATSAGFSPGDGEVKKIVGFFADYSAAQAGGIALGGTKYTFIRGDESALYGTRGASGGIVCAKTVTIVLIGTYAAPTQPGAATASMERLASYLREQGV